MGDAKSIDVRPITSAVANDLVRRVHYSGSVVNNSQVHLGVFLHDRLHGAMSFGPPMDRRKVLPLVTGSEWPNVVELNRMAFDEALPRNSESRALAVAFRLFRQRAPQVKWVLSFSDACQCGDGAIYRASGFILTAVKLNGQILERPDGVRATAASLTIREHKHMVRHEWEAALGLPSGGGGATIKPFLDAGCRFIPGYQLRYVRFLDPSWASRLAVPVIPFDDIPSDARMYRGARQP